jgi:signal transduction histidine kinase
VKKIALVFILAVFVPSLMLAWLAVRSLRDQQLILERQQFLLYQGVADSLAASADNYFTAQQHEFGQRVETLLAKRQPSEVAPAFDDRLRATWPMAEVGFVVTLRGDLLCPTNLRIPSCATFYTENNKFIRNVQSEEVYWNSSPSANTLNNGNFYAQKQALDVPAQTLDNSVQQNFPAADNLKSTFIGKGKASQMRNVYVQQPSAGNQFLDVGGQQVSKIASSEAEFRQLVGDSTEGSVARFLENKLTILLWYRSSHDTNLIFGAKLALPYLKNGLAPVVQQLEPALRGDIAVALLDDTARPVAVSRTGFRGNWKHPFAATEIGEALPHWEMAVYLLDPAKLAQSARILELTLGLLIAVLLIAIGVGAWLIFSDLNRHLTLARQKTDFVSNVSHELKTPLTSIRMFSELLAENRVTAPEKRQSYLNIITAETARLTRLINNVLDFSRMERGEKKYNFARCDLVDLVNETVETYRPHLESNGFKIVSELPNSPIYLNGDRDALAQVVVNLLSNAEKYSNGQKEITVQVEMLREPLPHAEVRVLDRGPGVPHGCEEKIFEQFYRAHDSLSSGIQGSGLGLTLARQIARAHAGDVIYRPRDGGGSAFTLRVPVPPESTT